MQEIAIHPRIQKKPLFILKKNTLTTTLSLSQVFILNWHCYLSDFCQKEKEYHIQNYA
jgi:hypothetical protein